MNKTDKSNRVDHTPGQYKLAASIIIVIGMIVAIYIYSFPQKRKEVNDAPLTSDEYRYEGSYDEQGLPHGQGTLTDTTGNYWKGTWQNGQKEGAFIIFDAASKSCKLCWFTEDALINASCKTTECK